MNHGLLEDSFSLTLGISFSIWLEFVKFKSPIQITANSTYVKHCKEYPKLDIEASIFNFLPFSFLIWSCIFSSFLFHYLVSASFTSVLADVPPSLLSYSICFPFCFIIWFSASFRSLGGYHSNSSLLLPFSSLSFTSLHIDLFPSIDPPLILL